MARNEELAIVVNARDQASRTLKKFGNNLDDLKEKARTFATRGLAVSTGALAALTAGASQFIRNASGFEDAMRGVAKTTGLAGDELEEVEVGLLELNKQTPTTKEELAQVGEEAGRLGVEGTSNILEFVRVADQIGVATDQSSSAAASNFAKILNSLNEPINRVQRLGDVVNALSNNTASSTSEIIQTMRKMGQSVDDDAQLSIEQVAALSAQFNALGQQSSRAGTRFARVLQRAKLPENMEKIAEATDRSVDEVEQRLGEDAIKVLREFLVETRRAGNQAEAINDVFGAIGERALAPLSKNFEQFQNTLGETEDATGSLEDEFDSAIQSLNKQAKILFQNMKSIFADIGLDILPSITERVKQFRNEISNLTDDEIERFTEKTLEWIEIITKASVALGGLSATILVLTSPLAQMTALISGAALAADQMRQSVKRAFLEIREQNQKSDVNETVNNLSDTFQKTADSIGNALDKLENRGEIDFAFRRELEDAAGLVEKVAADGVRSVSENEIRNAQETIVKFRKKLKNEGLLSSLKAPDRSIIEQMNENFGVGEAKGQVEELNKFLDESIEGFEKLSTKRFNLNDTVKARKSAEEIDTFVEKLSTKLTEGAISLNEFRKKFNEFTSDIKKDISIDSNVNLTKETKENAKREGIKIGKGAKGGIIDVLDGPDVLDGVSVSFEDIFKANELKKKLSKKSREIQGFVNSSVSDFTEITDEEFKKLVKQGEEASQDLKKSFENTFLNGLKGEFKTFEDFLEGFMRSVVNNIQRQMAKGLVSNTFIGNLTGALSAAGQKAGSGDASGFFSSIFNFFGDTPGVMEAKGGAFAHFKEDDKVAAAQNMSDLRAQVNGGGGGQTVVNKTVQNVSINAIDAKSFEQRLAESGGTINGLVNKNMRENGSTRDAMKDVM